MEPIEKRIPDFLTLCNLFCGFIAVLACLNGNLVMAGWLIFIGAIFDLFDGMAAKLLKASSPIGAQLDSLADMVTFGVVPALISYMLLVKAHSSWLEGGYIYEIPVYALLPILLVATASYRLARFNSDTSSKENFRGLPTPASAMFFASLPLMLQYDVFVVKFDILYVHQFIFNSWFLAGVIMLFSWLMVSNLPLFSLKISSLTGPNNKLIILFLVICVLLFAFLLWMAVPIIIILYIVFSYFIKSTPNEIQSAD
jgi:CDP-diacylglycerol---serine O-phosphatidyltransferase